MISREDNNGNREAFSKTVVPYLRRSFGDISAFQESTEECDGTCGGNCKVISAVSPLIIPYPYADDEAAQLRIAFQLTKMALVDMTRTISRCEGVPMGFTFNDFTVVDDVEKQIGLVGALMWRGPLAPRPDYGSPEIEKRSQRLKRFWDSQ